MIRGLHSADGHASPEKELKKMFIASIRKIIETIKIEKPDYVALAGDLHDRVMQNSDSGGFVELKELLKEILQYCPIFSIYGTMPTHDAPGSLEIYEDIKAPNAFKIIRPGVPYVFKAKSGEELLFLGIPEFNKSFIVGNKVAPDSGEVVTKGLGEVIDGFINGLGTIRRQYQNLPCVVLCHGEIKGASWNDKEKAAETVTSLSIEQLLSIGANYYSCAHIHLGQILHESITQIVRYEGSMFPRTWSERDQKAFSVVDFDGYGGDLSLMKCKRINFPHPPLRKVTADNTLTPEFKKGEKVWLEFECSEGEAKNFDTEKSLEVLIKQYGIHPESRVTKKVIKKSMVRAEEIMKSKTLFDKAKVYADAKGLAMPENIEELCKDAESNLKSLGVNFGKKSSLRLEKLELRGAIGIKKGQGKEEINIDFTKHGAGTIALIGENGCGKSTIIKNCHPYAFPIESFDSIRHDFYLRDSHSITYWLDTVSGQQYKAMKVIDGKNQSGKVEFYFYIKNGEEWQPYNEDINGKKDAYVKVVNEIFGSVELFKRSVYISQKDKSLPKTPKDRKELFNELLGNDYLEIVFDYFKNLTVNTQSKIQELANKLFMTENLESEIAENNKQLEKHEEEKKEINAGLSLALNAEKEESEELRLLQEQQTTNNERKSRINIIDEQCMQLDNETSVNVVEANSINEVTKGLQNLKDEKIEQDSITQQIAEKQDALTKIKNAQDQIDINYQTSLNEWNKKETELTKVVNDLERKLTNIVNKRENDISENKRDKETIKTLEANNACSKCGFIDEKSEEKIAIYKTRISARTGDINETFNSLTETEKLLEKAELNKNAHAVTLPNMPIHDENKNFDLTGELEELKLVQLYPKDYQTLVDKINVASTGANRLEYLNELIKNAQEKSEKFEAELTKLKTLLDDEIDGKVDLLATELKELQGSINAYKSKLSYLNGLIESCEKTDVKLKESLKAREEMQTSQNRHHNDLLKHKFLMNAFHRDGVQALELDALTPAIASQTNKLLSCVYDTKFEIEFSTTKEVGTGKDRRQAEDFELIIHDNEEEDSTINSQKLSTLSGGQEIIVLKALYDSFGIVREERSGLRFETNFLDETDGALSADNKHAYLAMTEDGHRQGGRFQTILVSHDQGIQTAIAEKIIVG